MHQIKLEKVLGVTVSNNAALTNDGNGKIAYPAGCTVVLFNTKTQQQNHIINVNKKTITALDYSSCGRYIVTGECGHQPAVRVWDMQAEPQSVHPGLPPQPQQVAEFVGHKFGVNCVAFSPTTKYVVSVGTQHDMIVNVWDWKNNIKIASNKVSTKVKSIAFADNGSYFVTVGNRHVKFWYLEHGKAKIKEAVPLMGRSAILGEQRNNYFCDVACGKATCGDSTYAITRSGLLCEFNNRRLLDKWVELRTTSANCITVGEEYIFVGCAEGIIRCFNPETLNFVTTLPRCHYLGVDVSLGTNIAHMASPPPDAKYPDTVAITYDEKNKRLTSIYNDHSIYVWDVYNIKRVGKSCSFLYHSACIWGVEMAPPASNFPPGSFLTCSSDDTIRVWTLDKGADTHVNRTNFQPNIYSKELLKVIYIDKDLSYIKDLDISGTSSNDKNSQDTAYDGRNGVRCIRISPDGKHLASGDRSGNIRIHDTSTMKETLKIEGHDAEVLCLEYATADPNYNLMASASRDRLIHVFDVNQGYHFVQTLDDHSSSITAVRFLKSNNLQMVSCGADKSLIFRSLSESNGKPTFVRDHNASGKTTLFDMEVDTGQKHVLTACQDRNVRIYSVSNGKHTKSFKGSSGDDGTLIKVVLDRSGIYLATSCTDKTLSVYDYYSGECMATMCGHSELATGLRFTNDCKRLVSASGDGCIFVWKVPHDMVITMHARLSQQAHRSGKRLDDDLLKDFSVEDSSATDSNYRFSVGQLPQWAKKQLNEDTSQPPSLSKGVAAPKGRWAQRAVNTKFVYPLDTKFDSDGSKDSSLDSGGADSKEIKRDSNRLSPTKQLQMNLLKKEARSAIGDQETAAHDADIDSDQEYRHRSLYYPTQADSPSGSEFTVTNMDQEELRKSQRKKKNPPKLLITPSNPPIYASNESDEDDDDASTPSGENTDRNPMSLLSISSESLDQLASREKYLQSTFESMSGAEIEIKPLNESSISAKFLRTGERNLEVINAVKQTKSDPEVIKKRQELSKRIQETKKKLESVGHGSPLKYSQSIHDLSHIPERDKWSRKKVHVEDVSYSSPDSSLRRSCSLSDLSMQSNVVLPKRKLDNVSGKKTQTAVSRSTSRYQRNNAITRSRSTTVLNASDSDNENTERGSSKLSRLMRPTISSHNKVATNKSSILSRKKQSYSTSNLNTVGIENISTSDDDVDTKKPVAPPRNRNSNYDSHGTSKKHLNNVDKPSITTRRNIHFDNGNVASDVFDLSNESNDLSSIETSNLLCDDTIDRLLKAAKDIVKLYDNLTQETDPEIDESQIPKIDRLRMSIIQTHKILHDCILKDLKQTNSHIDLNQTDTVKKLNDLISNGSTSPNSVVNIMDQYSDILMDMAQQKIHNSNI